jgi:hypothetical protein
MNELTVSQNFDVVGIANPAFNAIDSHHTKHVLNISERLMIPSFDFVDALDLFFKISTLLSVQFLPPFGK